MTLNPLALPVDIPWKRLCVSDDMIDEHVCDADAPPPRWRSSIAVFAYEPPAEHQTYDDSVISYLKVVCTVTGYQPHGEEVGVSSGLHYSNRWQDGAVGEAVLDEVGDYYACYGAILDVAVKPNSDQQKSMYPYFADFEPKKRELYELVTQTGESLSRSLDSVQVQKGATTTEGTEVLDVDKDIDWSSIGAIAGGVAGAAGGGPVGAVGGSIVGGKIGGLLGGGGGQNQSKRINQNERTDLQTTDRSRELREQYSHTTQLTQMYHQFTAYHLGTNRALFYMLPRPHAVQSLHTFVDGPRELEGIQEVFLVVMRPKSVQTFCVEANLETAHVRFDKNAYEQQERTFLNKVNRVDKVSAADLPDMGSLEIELQYPVLVPLGWEIDLDREGGVRVESKPSTEAAPKGWGILINSKSEVTGYWLQHGEGETINAVVRLKQMKPSEVSTKEKKKVLYYADVIVTNFLRRQGAKPQDVPRELFLTSRGVCCCPAARVRPIETVCLVGRVKRAAQYAKRHADGMAIRQANELRTLIGRMLVHSRSTIERRPRIAASFVESQMMTDRVARLIDSAGHPDNQRVEDIAGLRADVRAKIAAARAGMRRADLLRMSIDEASDRFGLGRDEALHLRRAALRLEEPIVDAKDRWDPAGSRVEITVPDVAGETIEDASAQLHTLALQVGEISYQDSEQPAGVVLRQDPSAGRRLRPRTKVNLFLATGLAARIPDVVGMPLSEALCALRDEGLRSEPELRFVGDPRSRRNEVTEVSPPARTHVTPNARIVLQVS